MNRHLKKTLLFGGAIIFLILGILGLALPFLQGFLFIAIGLILLSIASPSAREWIEHHTRKFPEAHAFVKKIETKVARWLGEEPPGSSR